MSDNAQGNAPAVEGLEVVAHMWQHDETGRIGFVDQWQVENGFAAGNPRLRILGALVRQYDAQAVIEGLRLKINQWEEKAANWIASPEAAKRLAGYMELAGQVSDVTNERDQLRAEVERLTTELAATNALANRISVQSAEDFSAKVRAEKHLAELEQDAARFQYLQNTAPDIAQAFFWNYSSRRERVKAIDAAMQAKEWQK